MLSFISPDIAARAVPGQFLHIKCWDGQDPILRRPLSIHLVDRQKALVSVFFRISGRGTSLLSQMAPGSEVDVLGPLGKGYTLPEKGETVVVLGGGIGAAPLFFLLDEIKKKDPGATEKGLVLLGVANRRLLYGEEQIKNMGFPLHVATDDGSSGFKGNVVDLYRELLGHDIPNRVYACGPLPMLKGLAAAVDPGTTTEVSVEEHMGCGLGACLSCVCKVSGPDGKAVNAHVCTDGPVFDLKEIIL